MNTEIEKIAMQMVLRECAESREEGKQAAIDGLSYFDCPYPEEFDELNRAGWLDGWSRQMAAK